MSKLTSFAGVLVLLFVLFAPAAEARNYFVWDGTDDVSFGDHPWDVRVRRVRYRPPNYYYTDNYFYTHPDRSQTYSLHPYHRDKYYDPAIDPNYERYARRYDNKLRYTRDRAYVPETAALSFCENYDFAKPNYRVPPYQYNCEE